MVIRERQETWPIMVVTTELKLKMFNVWLDTTSYSGCTGVCEYDVKDKVVAVIDCDVSTGRQDILDWWK